MVMDNARYQHCNAVKAHAAKLDVVMCVVKKLDPFRHRFGAVARG